MTDHNIIPNLLCVIICCFFYGHYVGKYEYSPKNLNRLWLVSILMFLSIVGNSLVVLLKSIY